MSVTKTEIKLVRKLINKNRSWARWLDLIAVTRGVSSEDRVRAINLAEELRNEAYHFEEQLDNITIELAESSKNI